jgi:hypothetical protein
VADEYGDPCDHIQHHGLLTCPGLTPEERERGERYRSVGWMFSGGQDMFHGDHGTIREQTAEMFANAKKYGNEPPEYVGPRSKMRSYDDIAREVPNVVDDRPKLTAKQAATKAVEAAGI